MDVAAVGRDLAGVHMLLEEVENAGEPRLASWPPAHELAVQIVGMGSVLALHFTSGPVRNYRDVTRADRKLLRRFVMGMLNEGVFLAPRGMMALSTPMTEDDLDDVVRAVDRVASDLA